jgi:tRNA-specific 2-thiouridylase
MHATRASRPQLAQFFCFSGLSFWLAESVRLVLVIVLSFVGRCRPRVGSEPIKRTIVGGRELGRCERGRAGAFDIHPSSLVVLSLVSAAEKILVGMSGGVDSSVAALLLKQQGHQVVGAYMKNWINEDEVIGHCPWMEDIEDARRVAEQIGIEFRVVNLMQEYRERVVAYLLDGYAKGLTPNPDIMCNREIKFGVFRSWAKDHGFNAVATGHYAQRQVERVAPNALSAEGRSNVLETTRSPRFELLEGADKNKDQSYFLALLSQEQLRDARFPIGHLPKPELRRLAREAGLATADKKDSQGICFIGEVKMQDFLRAYVPDAPGPIVRASDGRELGQHRGLHFYTLGQRKGIGVPSNTDHEAYVVVGKRANDRALLVAFDHPDAPGLFQREVRVHSLSWIASPLNQPTSLEGRVRYRDPRVAIEFIPEGGGTALVKFRDPQRGLASGQILALYRGEQLVGGGIYV